MARYTKTEIEEAKKDLRSILRPGDTVHTILRHVSRSGMMRHISVVVIKDKAPHDITWLVARALDYSLVDGRNHALKVGGCGMDMGFSVVYSLSSSLFRDNFFCVGDGCPANDHLNAYSNGQQNHCLVCQKDLPGATAKSANGKALEKHENASRFTRSNRGHNYRVCSEACATGPWKHSDAGYALTQRWI